MTVIEKLYVGGPSAVIAGASLETVPEEAPWSPRFEVRFDDDDSYSRPALRGDWREEGIGLGQVAVELSTGEGGSPSVLTKSYDIPSSEFAARFDLRQLPGTLDLVGFDGVRASATFRTEAPWRG